MKIIVGTGFGGLSFSDEFMAEYISRKYPEADIVWAGDELGETVPQLRGDFSFGEEVWIGVDNAVHLEDLQLRRDPVAIEILEEKGSEFCGDDTELDVVEIPKGTRYFITSDEGVEEVVLETEIEWSVA